MNIGYSTEGAVTYSIPNATSLSIALDETQISWFGEIKLVENFVNIFFKKNIHSSEYYTNPLCFNVSV